MLARIASLTLLSLSALACTASPRVVPFDSGGEDSNGGLVPPRTGNPESGDGQAQPSDRAFRADCFDLSVSQFEAWVASQSAVQGRWPADALQTLRQALDSDPATALRAAVLLALDSDPSSHSIFLERLERRVLADERRGDAADVLIASVFAEPSAPTATFADRLARLVLDPEPHPDLEVRVECGIALLAHGDPRPIPFLLRVLRIGTPAGDQDPRPWAATRHSTWARGRAAAALERAAGGNCGYQTEAGYADRDRAAACLESRLLTKR